MSKENGTISSYNYPYSDIIKEPIATTAASTTYIVNTRMSKDTDPAYHNWTMEEQWSTVTRKQREYRTENICLNINSIYVKLF